MPSPGWAALGLYKLEPFAKSPSMWTVYLNAKSYCSWSAAGYIRMLTSMLLRYSVLSMVLRQIGENDAEGLT